MPMAGIDHCTRSQRGSSLRKLQCPCCCGEVGSVYIMYHGVVVKSTTCIQRLIHFMHIVNLTATWGHCNTRNKVITRYLIASCADLKFEGQV